MGGTTMSPEGAMTSELAPVVSENDEPVPSAGKNALADQEQDSASEALDRADTAAFQAVEEKIREQLESVPELSELAQNLLIDMTPEGLRIQIVDQDGKPMFASGSIQPLPAAQRLLQLVGASVRSLPNQLSIRGHTDSVPYGNNATYTNWELSSDRANASRRVLLAGDATGRLPAARIENVQGKADREPLNAADPKAATNRRISIILLKQSLVAANKRPARKPLARPAPPAPRKQEEGVIYFP
jgi:chemotaxis protein MotB